MINKTEARSAAPGTPDGGNPGRQRRQNQGETIGDAASLFFRQGSPIAITVTLLAAAVGRLYVGSYTWWDLLPPAVVLAAQPLTEWLIHVFLLHFRPKSIGGYKVDPLVSRKHRAHHADPKDLELVFIPGPALVGLLGGVALLFLVPFSLPVGLSGLVGAYAMTLTYEWIHYLIHSSYRPRHRLYRYVWRAHRNHHYRNENYWFGVTVHLADHLLGTFPERSAVALSPTARTLGVDS